MEYAFIQSYWQTRSVTLHLAVTFSITIGPFRATCWQAIPGIHIHTAACQIPGYAYCCLAEFWLPGRVLAA